jgi:hypothetical protein
MKIFLPDDPEPPHLYDNPQFKLYANSIKSILQKSPNITIRQIHLSLNNPIPHWTLDALEYIGTNQSTTIPTKFSLAPELPPIQHHNYSHNFIFSYRKIHFPPKPRKKKKNQNP